MNAEPKKRALINKVAQAAVNTHLTRLRHLRATVLANTGNREVCSQALEDLQREHQELLKLVAKRAFDEGMKYAREEKTRSTAQTRP